MLEGTRVVELSNEVGGAMAGRLLATYGADVIVVEPPGGHAIRALPPRAGDQPDQSILFAYLGAGKRSLVLDLEAPASREALRSVIADAAVVIDSHAPGQLASWGLDPAALIEEYPGLVVCSLTPFGQHGPRSWWRSTALTSSAAGGQMALCGDPDKPPLMTAGHQAHYQAGLHAFAAILTALYASRESGLGDWIDLSVQEVQATTLEGSGPGALINGNESGRSAGNTLFAQWGVQPCKDGFVGIAAMPRQSFAVYDCIGHPELKDDPAFASGWSPDANAVLAYLIPEWTSQHTAAEIFAHATRFRAPFSMIPGPHELLEWPALRDSGFWRTVEHPVLGPHPLPTGPVVFGEGHRGGATRAPLLGEHTSEVLAELEHKPPVSAAHVATGKPALPFAGVRVIDVTQVWAGPYATRFLADMGAEVIKVEGPSFADPIRTMAGARAVPEINQSAYFNEYNRNKLGISLDLKQPEGMEALRRLIATADIFIENWSSGVADRIGLSYADLRRLKPGIIYISMPGFGHEGGDSARIGFGPTIEQMGGLVALQGYEGGPPHRSGISYGDPVSGTITAGAAASALLRRQRTGEGCYAMIPQRDVVCHLVGEFVVAEAVGHPLPVRTGNRDTGFAPHNLYRTADTPPRLARARPDVAPIEHTDTWLAIAVDSDAAWGGLARVIADPRLDSPQFRTAAGRHAGAAEVDAVITEWAATREVNAAASALQSAGVAASPVLTPLMLANDSHLAARGAFLPYVHPDQEPGRTAASPWRMRRRKITNARPAPRFGEHSAEVLARIGGYSEAEIAVFAEKLVTTTDLIPGVAG